MAILFACGAECGGPNEASSSGKHWLGQAGIANITLETTIVRPGGSATSYKIDTTTTTGRLTAPLTAAARHWVARWYVRRESGSVTFFSTGGAAAKLYYDGGSGNFAAQVGGGTVRQGPTCAVDTWYRIDLHWDTSTGTATLDWQIDGVAQTAATLTAAAANTATVQVGSVVSATGVSYLDDFICGDAATDYPFAAGLVLGYIADRDGTHSFTLGDFKDDGGTNIAVAATDAYTRVDEATANTSDYDAQTTVRSTGYLEFGFTPSDSGAGAPRAITAVGATFSTSAVSHNQKLVLNDQGTLTDLYALSGTGGLSLLNQGGTVSTSARTSAAFTKADLDALLVRWGYSTDTAPNPRLSRLTLEVEYGASETAATAGQAAGTGAAYGATTAIVMSAGLGSGGGAAYAAQISTLVVAAADNAAGTGTAYGATGTEAASASTASGTGAAYDAQIGDLATPIAGVAAGSGAASNVSTSVQAGQGIASATGSALAAGASVKSSTGLGSASGAAYAATTTAVASQRRARAGRSNLTCTRTF